MAHHVRVFTSTSSPTGLQRALEAMIAGRQIDGSRMSTDPHPRADAENRTKHSVHEAQTTRWIVGPRHFPQPLGTLQLALAFQRSPALSWRVRASGRRLCGASA